MTHCRTSSEGAGINRASKEDEEEATKWEALERLERLPTYERARKVVLRGVTGNFKEMNVKDLEFTERKELFDRVMINDENWHEAYLQRLKSRIDRVSLNLPTIEVRFEDLNVEAEAYVGKRALPTIINAYVNAIEAVGTYIGIVRSRKKKFSVLEDVSGIIKPGRLTLLLGPPGSGKSTLLQALSGKLDPELKVSGNVTYNGHKLHEFVLQRTAAYVSQYDVHLPRLTVRETLAFSAKCQGIGTSYDMLMELLRREKDSKIKPDPYLDALMKASIINKHKEDFITDYVLKILGLEICADVIVGDNMIRGISGGQKKRVTTGEMLVGPVGALFMDNISDGLDSSTTFQIIKSIKQITHTLNKTTMISLLQPPPETYELFDDIILLSEGQIVYQGPRENVLQFFESMGFRCPGRKGIADYLQEVTSRKDQGQYWVDQEIPYCYISVTEFVEAFKSFYLGRTIHGQLATPFDRSKSHRAALTKTKYGTSKFGLLKICIAREVLLMKRSMYVYAFKSLQLELNAIFIATMFPQLRKHQNTIEDGNIYLGAIFMGVQTIIFSGFFELPLTIDKLPVFYKQRDSLFYPSWAFSLPASILGFPISFMEVIFFVATTYYVIGYDPSFTRMLRHYLILSLGGQMSYALFRCIAAVTRDHVVANTMGCLTLMWLITFNGFVVSRDNIHKWLMWGYWTSPFMYLQTAISVNEFLGKSWRKALDGAKESLGIAVLKSRGILTEAYWYWVGILVLVLFTFLSNVVTALSLAYLNQYGKSKGVVVSGQSPDEQKNTNATRIAADNDTSMARAGSKTKSQCERVITVSSYRDKGMLLPFKPLTITFENITYSVDIPKTMKSQGLKQDTLTLLKGVSGAFRPGVLSALMGVSGAGKTTLMDVLAGRKNCGYVQGDIKVSGFPKKQETFARVSGYCEQFDIHSSLVTVYESLLYSAWLRLSPDISAEKRELFIEEVMELIELKPLRDMLVGFPTVNGLSTEQRKRLTIAVELVANPSIIFMDEPTSGLDARAAAIVMRTVRNTVETGRTVVCTIHQPSIDIFESFDELFLLMSGGEEIYVGPIGQRSSQLIEYFQGIKGVGRIREGHNPATWVLEVTTKAQEDTLGVKFSQLYKNSYLYRRNRDLITELSRPPPGAEDLYYPTSYPKSSITQFKACLWKQHVSYWRNVPYSAVRLVFSAMVGIMYGLIFWDFGKQRRTRQDIFNGIGAMATVINFVGGQSSATIRPIVIAERAVFYRERAARMYSALPYAFAQVAIEIPYTLVQSSIYSLIVYAMMGYKWTATKFFFNTFFMFITILYFIYFGIMVISVSHNQETGAILNGIFYMLWNLFSGFAIPSRRIPVWWRWFTWVCPVAWSLYGLSSAQYGDVETRLETGETVAEFMRDYFGFRHDRLWMVSLVLLAFALLFLSIYAFAIKVFNFQKK